MYEGMLSNNISAEDARYIFPNACESSLTMTINLRSLIDLCNHRLCVQAQWEIRSLVNKMVDEVVKLYPFTKEFLVSKCVKNNYCDELFKPCNKYPLKENNQV
jgi:thymidylate synthase (FAD)